MGLDLLAQSETGFSRNRVCGFVRLPELSSPKSESSGARLFNSLELDWPFAEARGEG